MGEKVINFEAERNCCNCKHTNVKENMMPCVACVRTAICGTPEYAIRNDYWQPNDNVTQKIIDKLKNNKDELEYKVCNCCNEDLKINNEKHDNVNHPKHYEGSTSLECIEAMIISFGPEVVSNFCMLNAFKYLWRWKNKNGQEDLNKARWYCDKFMEINQSFNHCSKEYYETVCQMSKYIIKHIEE